MSKWPSSEAHIRDVLPRQSSASRLAILATRTFTMSKWPHREAN
eukprot:CAMPEP_0172592434 /NCGR_PEP_ID=MMETSP1068-20121228/11405_1 /TAXON_ID=35684 /ORGANISM="Pseudopedinella elastica, Strain CCMP716" /LENGTH=43 /DNA_ID= /DNA_START= /DNA_END= /DNA_ORIENTATION=